MDNYLRYEGLYRTIANRINPDGSIQQDLIQEMRIAVWQAPEGRKDAYYGAAAEKAGLYFLRKYRSGYPFSLNSTNEAGERQEPLL